MYALPPSGKFQSAVRCVKLHGCTRAGVHTGNTTAILSGSEERRRGRTWPIRGGRDSGAERAGWERPRWRCIWRWRRASGGTRRSSTLDPQASAARWSDRRKAAVPVVLSAHASRPGPGEGASPGGWRRAGDRGHGAPLVGAGGREGGRLGSHSVPARDSGPRGGGLDAVAGPDRYPRGVGVRRAERGSGAGRDADGAAEAVAGLGVDVAPAPRREPSAVSACAGVGPGGEVRPSGKAAWEIAQVHGFMCAQVNLGSGK